MKFSAEVKKFGKNGEKTGWTYVLVDSGIAEVINPGIKKSFRVRGLINTIEVKQLALIPAGGGDFILALNADLRKKLKIITGEKVLLDLEIDLSELQLDKDFLDCLNDEKEAKKYFDTLLFSHQVYFSRWISSAKTESTKAKRIAMAVNALLKGLGYAEMIRENKASRAENKA